MGYKNRILIRCPNCLAKMKTAKINKKKRCLKCNKTHKIEKCRITNTQLENETKNRHLEQP